jgi:2-oxoglutarate dehydrogenase complex dehydrogenase (E1) component-like enzyme
LTQEDAIALRSTYKSRLEDHLTKVSSYNPLASMLKDQWSGMVWPASEEAIWDPDTGVEGKTLKTIGRASVKVPDKFVCGSTAFHAVPSLTIHPRYRTSIQGYSVMSNTV